MRSIHKTVLLNETIEGLNLSKDKNALIVDGTFGGGGHSVEILKKYPKAKIIAIDQDKSAWQKAKDKFEGLEGRIVFLSKNFRDLDNEEKVDGMEKIKRYQIATKIYKGKDVSVEELGKIKPLIGKFFTALIVGQVDEIFEKGNTNV